MNDAVATAQALYLEAIRDGNAEEAITKYSGARYTQHSTPVKDGPAGFIEDFHRRNPVRDIEIVRAWRDGRYVFLHVVQNLNDGEFRYVTADIFDTDEDGKLVEHWDMIAEMVDHTVSGHGQVDGPTVPIHLDRTEANKAHVRGFIEDVLIAGRSEKLTDYVSGDTYVQHNPQIGDGIEGLREFLAALAERGETMAYDRVHLLIGCGDFVAAMSEMTLAGAPMAVIDLFRVDDGLIVEHWDVMEEITPKETWVNSGKF